MSVPQDLTWYNGGEISSLCMVGQYLAPPGYAKESLELAARTCFFLAYLASVLKNLLRSNILLLYRITAWRKVLGILGIVTASFGQVA